MVSEWPQPPTYQEMRDMYPAKLTWAHLATFVNAGNLALLRRHKDLQIRYEAWGRAVANRYGSIPHYVLQCRLRWGEPDTQCLLDQDPPVYRDPPDFDPSYCLPPLPDDAPALFTLDIPKRLISIMRNDWPYSVPLFVEHYVVWSRVPIIDYAALPDKVRPHVHEDGLWGFTGAPAPAPYFLPLSQCMGVLVELGITPDKIRSVDRGSYGPAGIEVERFVRRQWPEDDWETAWFVNPHRLQSIPDLSHVHVFARHKIL